MERERMIQREIINKTPFWTYLILSSLILINFQESFIILHQDEMRGQRWPHPSRLRSGTLNILQATQRPDSDFHDFHDADDFNHYNHSDYSKDSKSHNSSTDSTVLSEKLETVVDKSKFLWGRVLCAIQGLGGVRVVLSMVGWGRIWWGRVG